MRRIHAHRAAVAAAVLALAAGCANDGAFTHHGMPLPPVGGVPRELEKVTLPPYVVEPPDQLLIEVVSIVKGPVLDKDGKPVPPVNGEPVEEYKAYSLPVQSVSGQFTVRPQG